MLSHSVHVVVERVDEPGAWPPGLQQQAAGQMEGSPLAPRPSDPTKAIINVDGESSKKLLGLIDDDYLPEDCDLTPEQIASFREASAARRARCPARLACMLACF